MFRNDSEYFAQSFGHLLEVHHLVNVKASASLVLWAQFFLNLFPLRLPGDHRNHGIKLCTPNCGSVFSLSLPLIYVFPFSSVWTSMLVICVRTVCFKQTLTDHSRSIYLPSFWHVGRPKKTPLESMGLINHPTQHRIATGEVLSLPH